MSIHTVLRCDQCGKECQYDTIYAAVDRRMDGAGSMETVTENVDLCPIHMRMLMSEMVKEMDHEQAAAWVKRAREKKPPMRV